MWRPDNNAVRVAVKAFVRAIYFDPPEKIYQMLVENRGLLLSEEAKDYMDLCIFMDTSGGVDRDFDRLQLQLTPRGANAPVPSLKAIFKVPMELLQEAR